MKLKFSTLRNLTIGILLAYLGAIAGYNYALLGELPGGIKLKFLDKTSRVSSLVRTAKQADTLSAVNGKTQPSAYQNVDFKTFWDVWQLLEYEYLEPEKINAKDMVDGAIGGMTASLGDPYTMYLPAKSNQRSSEDLAGSFYGVGIELGYKDGVLAVVAPLDGTPAAQAGIKAGDLILRVKDLAKNLDEDSTKWSLDEAVDKIRGQKNTTVTLNLFRENYNDNKPFDIEIKRGEIVVHSVKLEFLENKSKKIAHLKVSRFGERTNSEWNEAVAKIKAEKNLAGIILDLRNNPGGYFDTSIDLASDFLKKGQLVVSQKDRQSSHDFVSNGTNRLAGYKLLILVNKGSASASEILAGALRDQLGAKLMGEKTFGKGTVQDRRELNNGAGIHITIARWLLPKGSWIHDEGIPVDIEVEQNYDTEADEILDRAVEEF